VSDADKSLALLRDGERWYAVRIKDRDSGHPCFRISVRGTRDAFKLAEQVDDIEVVARRVILEGAKMRCATESSAASSLSLKSRGVTGYELAPALADRLGVPSRG
jgi:hypothetical protein